jgi:hypothetical protein
MREAADDEDAPAAMLTAPHALRNNRTDTARTMYVERGGVVAQLRVELYLGERGHGTCMREEHTGGRERRDARWA